MFGVSSRKNRGCLDGHWSSLAGIGRKAGDQGGVANAGAASILSPRIIHPLTCRDLSKLREETTRKRVSMVHNCLNNRIAATTRAYCIRRTLPTRFDASFRALALVKSFQGSTGHIACPWGLTQSSQPRARRKTRRSRTASSKALESSLRRLCVVLKRLNASVLNQRDRSGK